jgi:glycosyltransferase involved in cell wall biosynthesis
MTIALVVTNLEAGGAERVMLRIAAGLGARGHSVHLIALEHIVAHEIPPGVELHSLTRPGVAIRKGVVGVLRAAGSLRLHYRRWKIDRTSPTLSTLPFADRVVAASRLPNVWHRIANTLSLEAEALDPPHRRTRRLARYRRLYEGRNLIAVSDGVAGDLRGPIGLSRARIVRIHNGVDASRILQQAGEPEPDLPREAFVLHVGRFAKQKRHDVLLDAWSQAGLPHRLVLLTKPEPELEAMIAARGLAGRVTIAGVRPNPFPWMRAAELLVLCSDREGLPNVILEALACGTRVVSTDCHSGPREILTGSLERGLVPCGDAAALAAAMRAALERPRPAPGVPDAFTEARMVDAYERVLTGG